MSELKPCPFCGGEAEFYANINGKYIHCTDCGAWMNYQYKEQPDHIAERWNTRTGSPIAGGLRGCPNCGSYTMYMRIATHDIECPSCGMHLRGNMAKSDYTEAIARWNRRVHND